MEYLRKISNGVKPREGEIILVTAFILVSLISFGLGRFSALRENKFPIRIENQSVQETGRPIGRPVSKSTQTANLFVASKNGQVFHYPWCPGARRIKEENKIFFSSKEEAQKAGYRPAANCEGL